ncbi:MAG: transglycosylase domain-containing protein [Anaerolineae bacterium]|nr:transglycosylase domain-containing protein [Anaerolineae bacterium]
MTKKRVTAALALLLFLLALGAAWTGRVLLVDLPSPDTLYARQAGVSSRILDRHGRLLYEIIDPHAGRHTPVPLDAIPLACRQATVATEDANFYTNPGVDVTGILRALWINVQGGEVLAGGSTITQQVARNVLLDPQERAERTLVRKLRESILAWRIARAYSKDEVLAIYLNETYYGNLAYGIDAAARAIFGKDVSGLGLAECALLAGLPQGPAVYDPLIDPEAAQERQRVVLRLMVEQGYINAEQARLAAQEPLQFAAVPFAIEAPHFVMTVRAWLEDAVGLEALYTEGLLVTTTLDLDLQHTAQRIVRRHLERLAQAGEGSAYHDVNNAALVALDPQSGQILALLGSPDYFDPAIDGAVNAALALRQPGSAIKPLTYAAAFDPRRADPLTPAAILFDVRTAFPTREGTPYVPANYDSRFHGPVSAREALACSYNVPAVSVLQQVGVDQMVALAGDLGLSSFGAGERFGLALTLGGGEVRLLELTAAYAAFANGGQRVTPYGVLEVRDASGALRYRSQPGLGSQVLDARVAYLVTDILADNAARAPAFGSSSVLSLSRPAAAKTGTSSDWRDNWTVGYTPQLVAGVWAGNADGRPMVQVSGVEGAGPIWHDFMELALRGQPVLSFSEPPGLERVQVCAPSGLLPTPYCPRTRTELFVAGTAPTRPDDWYRLVELDVATGQAAGPETPENRVAEQVFVFPPAEVVEWARAHGWPLLPAAAGDATGSADDALVLTSPDAGTVYRLSQAVPAAYQSIRVAARPGDGVALAEVTLYADGAPLSTLVAPPYEAYWRLSPGTHTFHARAVDVNGRALQSATVSIEVRP